MCSFIASGVKAAAAASKVTTRSISVLRSLSFKDRIRQRPQKSSSSSRSPSSFNISRHVIPSHPRRRSSGRDEASTKQVGPIKPTNRIMSPNKNLDSRKIQPPKPTTIEPKAATKSTAPSTDTEPALRSQRQQKSENVSLIPIRQPNPHPVLLLTPHHSSPKTQSSPNTQPEIRKTSGAFGKYTFGPEVMGWSVMGKMNTDPVRSRGASVMPEPETDERMKELGGGMKGGMMGKGRMKSKAKVEISRK